MKYLVSLLLLLTTTTVVVHGLGAEYMTADAECMSYEDDGHVHLSPCFHPTYEFELNGNQFVASKTGKCLSSVPTESSYYHEATFEDCTAETKQQWTLHQDGHLSVEVEDDGVGGSGPFCLKKIEGTTKLKVDHDNWPMYGSEGGPCILWHNPAAGASGDPIIMGVKGQQFKFDGRDGGWYANLAAKELQWNMRFKKFDTCPEGDDMFVSSLAYSFDGGESKILIAATPVAIPQCQQEGAVCLGDGTLHISFDGGETFVSNPNDYTFSLRSRLVAHNTYAACSKKWFDYNLSVAKQEQHLRRGDEDPRRQLQATSKKTSLDYLTEEKRSMINPTECEQWMQERLERNDLFLQDGEWSTIHIETPAVSLHLEYRRNNAHKKVDGQCQFQSLDSWMTNVSPSLHNDVWNGILGETRLGDETDTDRFKILRGKQDTDYEVDGPFGRYFPALHIATTVDDNTAIIQGA